MTARKAKKWPTSGVKLDIGSGHKGWMQEPLDEWLHLDLGGGPHVEIQCDFGDIPLEDGACDEIFIGDIIEHVPGWRYDEVLSEWNRVLKMGGIIKGRCPNGDRAMRCYADGEIPFEEALQALYGWANHPFQQHYMCFEKRTLTALLKKYGFDVTDYSGSPGPPDRPWWLVFVGRKV